MALDNFTSNDLSSSCSFLSYEPVLSRANTGAEEEVDDELVLSIAGSGGSQTVFRYLGFFYELPPCIARAEEKRNGFRSRFGIEISLQAPLNHVGKGN